MPHDFDYDAAARRLKIGTGFIDVVSPAVWAYEVSMSDGRLQTLR